MTTDRVLAVLALLCMAAFVATVPIFVPDIDLIVVAAGGLLLATYDFWSQLFRRRKD